jgi:hypothetical protein
MLVYLGGPLIVPTQLEKAVPTLAAKGTLGETCKSSLHAPY